MALSNERNPKPPPAPAGGLRTNVLLIAAAAVGLLAGADMIRSAIKLMRPPSDAEVVSTAAARSAKAQNVTRVQRIDSGGFPAARRNSGPVGAVLERAAADAARAAEAPQADPDSAMAEPDAQALSMAREAQAFLEMAESGELRDVSSRQADMLMDQAGMPDADPDPGQRLTPAEIDEIRRNNLVVR